MVSTKPLFLAGQWRETESKASVVNPTTGETLALVSQASEAERGEAIRAALTAFETFSRTPRHLRANLLSRIASGILQRSEELSQLICREVGKPITYARSEVSRAATVFTLASEECKRFGGEIVPLDIVERGVGYSSRVEYFPVGVVIAITPFNFPLNLLSHKVAPALAAGCPIIAKPAPQSPLTALLLAEIVKDAGVPDGVFSVLPMPVPVAEGLVTDRRIAAFSFTGSAKVGWALKEKSGRKKVLLELGGNAAVIVHKDTDVVKVAKTCAVGAFAYAGQICISVQRIYVHDQIFDTFLNALKAEAERLVVGDPEKEDTVVGPVIDDKSADRLKNWIQDAIEAGADLITGGRREGRFIQPTILVKVRTDLPVICEEAFGPVVVIDRYNDFNEAIKSVNDSPYGLQAGVFTQDIELAFRAFRELETGGVIINDTPMFRIDNFPYGGIKASGYGREGIRYAMEAFSEPKIMVVRER